MNYKLLGVTKGRVGTCGSVRLLYFHSNSHDIATKELASCRRRRDNANDLVVRIRPADADDPSVPPRFRQTLVHPISPSELRVDVDPAALAGNAPGSLSLTGAGKRHPTFVFDHVLDEAASQVALYESTAKDVIDDFLKGHNVTFLAYGQTSSGKSYSMGTTGEHSDYSGAELNPRTGLIPRTVQAIFEKAEELRIAAGPGASWECRLSFLELYNEEIIDLLSGTGVQIAIREERDGRIIWAGVREVRVSNLAEVMQYLQEGSERRQTGSTSMNATSSRSHAIFSLTMIQKRPVTMPSSTPSPMRSETPTKLKRPSSTIGFPPARSPTPSSRGPPSSFQTIGSRVGGLSRPISMQLAPSKEDDFVVVTSKFNMVDLAGSERLKRTAAQGERMKEGISINSGLLALGNVISTLADPVKAKGHIPYRDSKLTRMLQDSIGGNALTTMIACVSGIEYNIGETLNTIKYASRARNIKNSAKINQIEVGWDDVEHLQATVLKLRKQLASVEGEGRSSVPASEENQRHAEKLLGRLAELQREHTDLYDRYLQKCSDNMRLTNELRTTKPGDGDALAKFNETVEPVILEYEKVVAVLNKQLDDLRLEIVALNDLYEDQGRQLQEAQQRFAQNETYVVELRNRLAKLTERNSSSESYIHDIEAKLKAHSDKDDNHCGVVGDLKKEIVKLKEGNARLEQHTLELEARLAKTDAHAATLVTQIEQHEKEAERREASFRDLESHIALLDTSKDNKLLLEELEKKDARIVELEKAEEERNATIPVLVHDQQMSASSDDGRDLAEELSSEQMTRVPSTQSSKTFGISLEPRLEPTPSRAPSKTVQDLTPPHSPAAQGIAAKEAELEALRDMLGEMSARCAAAENRCNDAEGKIAELQSQLTEAKLITAELEDSVVTPSLASPREDDMTTEDESMLQTPQGLSPVPSPTKGVKGSRRGSMPILTGAKVKDFRGGRGYGERSRRPQSLSQELSSASLSHISPRSSWSGSSSMLLGASPTRLGANGSSPDKSLRSYQSVEAELKFVHKVVQERDDELRERENYIRELEARLRETREFPSPNENANTNTLEIALAPQTPAKISPQPKEFPLPASPPTPIVKITAADVQETILSSPVIEQSSPALSSSTSDKRIKVNDAERVAELQEMMAVKEASHREVIEQQFIQIADLQKANNKLRQELGASHPELAEELEEMKREKSALLEERTQALSQLVSEIETHKAAMERLTETTDRQKAEHEADMEKVRVNFSTSYQQMQAKHATELERLKAEHAKDLVEIEAQTTQAAEEVRAKLLVEHSGKHEATLVDLQKTHEGALAHLRQTHNATIDELRTAHEKSIADLEASHHRELADLRSSHETAMTDLQKEHEEKLAVLQAESDAMVADMEQMLNTSEDQRRQLKMKADQTMFELSRVRDEHQVQRNNDLRQITELSKLRGQYEKTISDLQVVNAELQKKVDSEHRLSRKASALPPSGPPPSVPLPPLPFSPASSSGSSPKAPIVFGSPVISTGRLSEGSHDSAEGVNGSANGQAIQKVVEERDVILQEKENLTKRLEEEEKKLHLAESRLKEEEQKTVSLTRELADTRKTNSRLRAHLEEARQENKRTSDACVVHMQELEERRDKMQNLSDESARGRDSLTAANAQIMHLKAALDKASDAKVNKRMLKCF
ncbi:hypothetical protein M231_02625 [Tremella mesenterica]|uniref:Kinesin motor domain-containing protein n=1 Tax=Tremella mesenterica TaxID=5217 RepID=A0A4V1M4F3_TREME|nr:hypothetical protein M231_02625 [Tremella mesenterica]